jgi:Fe2+ or Zn2+ uptake regulation protein
MTHAPRTRPLAFRDIDDVARAVRAAGGRFSMPRRRVLEALFAADEPLTAEQVGRRVSEPLDPATVYRALESLEQLGAVRPVHAGHGPGRYALVGDGEREYLACERCRRVTTVAPERLDEIRARIEADFGYRVAFSHFPLVGLCADCAAATDA